MRAHHGSTCAWTYDIHAQARIPSLQKPATLETPLTCSLMMALLTMIDALESLCVRKYYDCVQSRAELELACASHVGVPDRLTSI